MAIGIEPFASEGHFLSYDAYAAEGTRVEMFRLACRSCGFEPDDTVVAPSSCPKCHGKSWERYTRPGSILDNAQRF
jgi:rubrerythrin